MSELQKYSSQSSQRSDQRRGELGEKERYVVAPEKHPAVKWHSMKHVTVFRYGGQIALFVLFLIVFVMVGPVLITIMYPSVVRPFVASFEWRFTPLAGYSSLLPSKMGLETNLLTTSPLNIQIYLKENLTTFDDLEHVWLVIDDGSFDHMDNVVICRPLANFGARPSFSEHVTMAETCYLYVRQITRKALIIGYGRGIAANVLLAAAVKLRADNCFAFEKMYLEEPIPDIREEFETNIWLQMVFILPSFRNRLIADFISETGLDDGELARNVEKVGRVPVFIINSDVSTANKYKTLGGPVQVIRNERFNTDLEMQQHRIGSVSHSKSGFQFRHSSEEECSDELNRPVTLLHVL